eukprot:m.46643 g.46643  ORF g.46643 m.46643 type:complete len:318 (+) comp6788_c0_seq1:1037-1990(+)
MQCECMAVKRTHTTATVVTQPTMASAAARVAGPRVPRIAVAQMRSTDVVEDNFDTVRRLVQRAADQGCSLVSLPECFEWIGSGPAESLAFAQRLDEPLFTRYRHLAKEFQIWVSYGGFHERPANPTSTDGRIYNSHLLINPQGDIVANYHKAHMFDADTADGAFKESSFTCPGDKQVLVTGTPVGNVGLTTCYDLRFPQVYTNLRRAGADVLLVPSAFMPSTGEAHWESLLRARAIETQCYVAAAAQYGQHNAKRKSHGHSMVIDPWGKVVAQLGGSEEGIAVADVDPEWIAAVRAKMPVAKHDRTSALTLDIIEGL